MTRKAESKAKANAEYQKVVSTLMTFATALIAVPPFLLRDFLGVAPAGQPLFKFLNGWIYSSWISFGITLAAGIYYYFLSAKWLRHAYGGPAAMPDNKLEKRLNNTFRGTAVSFAFGFVFLMVFIARS